MLPFCVLWLVNHCVSKAWKNEHPRFQTLENVDAGASGAAYFFLVVFSPPPVVASMLEQVSPAAE